MKKKKVSNKKVPKIVPLVASDYFRDITVNDLLYQTAIELLNCNQYIYMTIKRIRYFNKTHKIEGVEPTLMRLWSIMSGIAEMYNALIVTLDKNVPDLTKMGLPGISDQFPMGKVGQVWKVDRWVWPEFEKEAEATIQT